ncbi:MAG: hypothetical protein M3P27_01775 [Acidobacteriota bacterium]|nr:hypothetical protein [Acidobacteriota bacterium]
MPTESPIRYGFRTVWREPTLALAEIAWRWVWGASALLIAWFAARGYLQSLTISNFDQFRLDSGKPQWMAEAIVHIFSGSGPTLLRLCLVITPAAFVLWICAATFGRAATLRALLSNGNGNGSSNSGKVLIGRTFALHLWRVVIGALAFVGIAASFLLGTELMARTDPPQPLFFMAVFFPLAIVFTVLRSRINWLLLLANIYAAAGKRAGAGFGEATRIFKRRSGEFVGVGTVVGLFRLMLTGAVTLLTFALLPGVGKLPGKLLWAIFLLMTLAYFAVSDWLYAVKLAAYTRIVRSDIEAATQPANTPARAATPPPVAPDLPVQV